MTGYYSIVWYFAGMTVILAVAASPLLRLAGSPPSAAAARASCIDGLRGFLALAVFFHHGAVYHNWLLHRVWAVPPSRFYTQLGQSGVAFFFMITGYLFWARLLRAGGRRNFLSLYIGRLLRIGPLYLLSIVIMLGVVFHHTGLVMRVPRGVLLGQIGRWLALGFFGNGPDVKAYPLTGTIIAAVAWSLQYEWWFYISLMATSFLARLKSAHLGAVVLAFLALCFLPIDPITRLAIGSFLCGMATASLEQNGLLPSWPGWLDSLAILLLLTIDFREFATAFLTVPVLLMGLCFYLVVSGGALFGLLTSRGAIRLGDISYGTYLLQGLVLRGVFDIPGIETFALQSPLAYWCVLLAGAVVLIMVATITHVAIERPGIALGKRLIKG